MKISNIHLKKSYPMIRWRSIDCFFLQFLLAKSENEKIMSIMILVVLNPQIIFWPIFFCSWSVIYPFSTSFCYKWLTEKSVQNLTDNWPGQTKKKVWCKSWEYYLPESKNRLKLKNLSLQLRLTKKVSQNGNEPIFHFVINI